jgi:hypothetical protein
LTTRSKKDAVSDYAHSHTLNHHAISATPQSLVTEHLLLHFLPCLAIAYNKQQCWQLALPCCAAISAKIFTQVDCVSLTSTAIGPAPPGLMAPHGLRGGPRSRSLTRPYSPHCPTHSPTAPLLAYKPIPSHRNLILSSCNTSTATLDHFSLSINPLLLCLFLCNVSCNDSYPIASNFFLLHAFCKFPRPLLRAFLPSMLEPHHPGPH